MTKIIKTPHTSTGYSIQVTDENGTTTTPINEIVDEGKTLKLPSNPSNRKYFSVKKVEDANGEIELTYKETIHLSPKLEKSEKSDKSPAPKKDDLTDYLDDEDKKPYEDLIKKATKRKEIALAKKRLEQAQKELDDLMNEENEEVEEA